LRASWKEKPVTQEIDKFVQELQEEMLRGYSEKLKDEFLNPQNLGKIEDSDSYVRVTGVCGDTVEMYLLVHDGAIRDIKFMTDGCGPTIACASYVARTAKGKTVEAALRINPEDVDAYFDGLPEAHKHCATLSILTLRSAIENYRSKSARTGEKGEPQGLAV
jgi:nitrogen fixation NifU-like protein